MSANRNAQLRYRILDRCLKDWSRDFTIYDLQDAVNEVFCDLYGKEVSLRTIRKDIDDMKERLGFNAPIKTIRNTNNTCYYRYSDPKYEIYSDSMDAEDMNCMLELLQKFRGLPSMAWVEETISRLKVKNGIGSIEQKVISFEHNERLQGLNFLSELVDATIHHECLTIDYRSYKGTVLHKTIHPYYLKQYNSRWYLFGLDNEYGNVYPLALDRITSVKPSKTKFLRNTTIDFEEYFSDIIGVTRDEGYGVEEIRLRFSPHRFPYVVSKPLHVSQRTLSDERCEVAIVVRPNKELQQQLFSFGPDVEILSPDWIRRDFAEKIQETAKKYFALQTQCKEPQ